MTNYTEQKHRRAAHLDAQRNQNTGYPNQRLPARTVAARKRIEDLKLAREVGVPVGEILE